MRDLWPFEVGPGRQNFLVDQKKWSADHFNWSAAFLHILQVLWMPVVPTGVHRLHRIASSFKLLQQAWCLFLYKRKGSLSCLRFWSWLRVIDTSPSLYSSLPLYFVP